MEKKEEHILARGVVRWYEARNYITGTWVSQPLVKEGFARALACRDEPGCEEAKRFCALLQASDLEIHMDGYFLQRGVLNALCRHPMTPGSDGMVEYLAARLAISVSGTRSILSTWMMKAAMRARYPAALSYASTDSTRYADYDRQQLSEFEIHPPRAIVAHEEGGVVVSDGDDDDDSIFVDKDGEERGISKTLRQRAASLGDPFGIYLCGLHDGDYENRKFLAAQLGCAEARDIIWRTYPLWNPMKWTCGFKNFEMDVNRCQFEARLTDLLAQTRGRDRPRILYHVGRLLAENANGVTVSNYGCLIAGQSVPDGLGRKCAFLKAFYTECAKSAMLGVMTWSLCSKRGGRGGRGLVVKDIRLMIAKLVWERRFSWFDWDSWRAASGYATQKKRMKQ